MGWRLLVVGLVVACGGEGHGGAICLCDASIGDVDDDFCNPLSQMGCAAGEACGWIVDQDNPTAGHVGCHPAGPVPTGGSCVIGAAGPTGFSDCVKGTECVGGRCLQICDHRGGVPRCDALHACNAYDGVFAAGNTISAGLCERRCDPLTQLAGSGGDPEACGSLDPAMPTRGCYTDDLVDFACAPAITTTRLDGDPGGDATGRVFANGCAPGFLPLLRETTGSTTVLCAGLCAPLKTDSTLAVNVRGDASVAAKLPGEAAPAAGNATCEVGKKGSVVEQGCVFLWAFNVENGSLPESPYNDTVGVCFPYGRYRYDHDLVAATPDRPAPSCATLPPALALPAECTCAQGRCTGAGCPDGVADEWGCYASTELTHGVHPALASFRISYGGGPLRFSLR